MSAARESHRELRRQFANPEARYRGKPFWAWNGRLEEQELRRQVRVFKQMGLGGGFMHSRVGLATPYLSEEWFDLVRAVCDEAQQQGLEAWLYDEDRWPSGAAGGLVTRNPRHQARKLVLELIDPFHHPTNRDPGVGEWIGRVAGRRVYGLRAYRQDMTLSSNDMILHFEVRNDPPNDWYNGYTYLDTLSHEAVAEFIRVTHEAYGREVLSQYGPELVPGIFTDEPNYGRLSVDEGGAALPWTDRLPEVFQERYGYDLLDKLPELVLQLDSEVFSTVRRDYFDCLTWLFTDAFARQIGDWCEANQQMHTGHVLEEPSLERQSRVVGAAMRFYEHMQAPGIDILRGQGLERPGGCEPELLTAKQCSSVLHQSGRTWMLSELYGCTGWDFSFAEHKAVGDWQAALGVNLRCQHLSWYTMLGQAKRDYPASIFFQSAWHRDYAVVEDYFARLHVWLTRGQPVRDVAVLHPIESAWGLFPVHDGPLQKLDDALAQLTRSLLAHGIDFDFVDEEHLARKGQVTGSGQLQVGEAVYRAVVVPPMLTMRNTTLDELTCFSARGGRLLFAGNPPGLVDGHPSKAVSHLAAGAETVAASGDAAGVCLRHCPQIRKLQVSADGAMYPHVLHMLRQVDDGSHVLFLCHTRQQAQKPVVVTVEVPGAQGQVQEWDAATGRVAATPSTATESGVRFHTTLENCGSRLFVISPEGDPDLELRTYPTIQDREPIVPSAWAIGLDEPNAVVLDRPDWRIDQGEWQPALEILRLDQEVRKAGGWPLRGGRMVQPWAREAGTDDKVLKVGLRYTFRVEALPPGDLELVMELPDRFGLNLNGNALFTDEDRGWWIDNSFRKVLVPRDALKLGDNRLLLAIQYDADYAGFEAIYLTGSFSVTRGEDGIPVLGELPAQLQLGDWTTQGLREYTGAVAYRTPLCVAVPEGCRAVLSLPEWAGTVARVKVDGELLGHIAWPGQTVDLTDAIAKGGQELTIEVVASRRNLLGPLHYAAQHPAWTGPAEFVSSGEQWTDDYMTAPVGLIGPPVVNYLTAD